VRQRLRRFALRQFGIRNVFLANQLVDPAVFAG
jgi:hypothetical protein